MTQLRTVAVSGFWYSGSSAISDFLTDHAGCLCFSSDDTEPRLIRGEWEGALGEVLALLRQGRRSQKPAEFVARMRQSVLGGQTEDYNQAMNLNLITRLGPGVLPLLEALFENLATPGPERSVEEILGDIRRFYTEACRLVPGAEPQDVILFNNDPPSMFGTLAAALEAYPGCRAIAVLRDPRDMFAEVSRFVGGAYGPTAEGLEKWLWAIGKSLDRFTPLVGHPDLRLTMFETFVQDPEEREALRRFAGVGARKPGPGQFDPARSARNIGVYRSLDPAFLARIEAEVTPRLRALQAQAGLR